VVITGAAPSYEDQRKTRVRKYAAMMAVRFPAMVFAALAYGIWHSGLISLAIIAISIPLPWAAVLIANDRAPQRKWDRSHFDPAEAEVALGLPPGGLKALADRNINPDGTPRQLGSSGAARQLGTGYITIDAEPVDADSGGR
jgi:hypothetical protein